MTKKSFEPNPSLFAEMSRPFPSEAVANESIAGFQEEFRELRKKYKLPSLLFVAQLTYVREDGEVGEAMVSGGFGDVMRFESMAAWLLGREQQDRQHRIQDLLKQGLQALAREK